MVKFSDSQGLTELGRQSHILLANRQSLQRVACRIGNKLPSCAWLTGSGLAYLTGCWLEVRISSSPGVREPGPSVRIRVQVVHRASSDVPELPGLMSTRLC